MDNSADYNESTTVTLEWTLRGLKNLFDSSKGDGKSKVTKSVRFGANGRWQILFYANSGAAAGASASESGGFVSLYLACEPTLAEKESGVNGKWTREGLYNFRFEMRPLGKAFQFNSKEAHNRSFSSKTANLGWAQFALRDSVYYQAATVKSQDAFIIICTITTAAAPPAPLPTTPRQAVPREIMESMGSLLDDPLYSDIEFIIPIHGQPMKNARRIYAISKLLKRVEYYALMFNSGFSETLPVASDPHGESIYDEGMGGDFADSDGEDEDELASAEDDPDLDFDDARSTFVLATPVHANTATLDSPNLSRNRTELEPESDTDGEGRNVRQKLSHPASPLVGTEREPPVVPVVPGPSKIKVVVRDASYWTYRAVLYYLYTDTIIFAPLSSSFLTSSAPISTTPDPGNSLFPAQTPADERAALNFSIRPAQGNDTTPAAGPKSRKEWIQEWEANNPGRPRPCSAKAVYRLADRLDLSELKERAFQHIVKSLTVENVPYEAFSTFSAMYEEVRKVQVSFFLENWNEIRTSGAMRDVWQQIRLGRHPGFEEVWPLIALNLEFKTRTLEESGRETPAVET